jgi:hypothetical protein
MNNYIHIIKVATEIDREMHVVYARFMHYLHSLTRSEAYILTIITVGISVPADPRRLTF